MIVSRGVVFRAGGRQLSRVLGGARPTEQIAEPSKSSAIRLKSSGPSDSGFCQFTAGIMPETVPMYPTLEKLGLLNAAHVRIKDLARVEELVSSLASSGFSKLQVIADFDRTMTRVSYFGKLCDTCHGIMDNSSLMPSFYREEANKLLAKYYPIEIDPKMSEEEKIPYMIEWYSQIHELIIKCKVSQKSLEEMVTRSNARLRDGTRDLCKKLHECGVPVLVFSAGMGDILEQVLRHFDVYTDNIKVVSNFFKYDEEGIVVGFEGDLIHMFNKNENAIHSSDYFDKLTGRNNVILLGDSLGDIKMAVGVPQPSNVLKIGFLNDKVEERLEAYMNGFDIVLIDDQTMDLVNSIVRIME
ncbi:cytosolic 5'-nucleotidase 3-like isoform X1 [Penaeus monodon]|uniref:cytosolic 5'-nucleotidase 3-like isoform X1 n=1 Tax=Penaeus monodon TaxID=6687 RepID=UPI0018A79657|nr:cytosolic 5'-nucleotidase 3-like isoform X1 [Penaeus monodon]XP_037778206.1 cytosolic 5'-nucleotidase 3-like isoform X1 [Penaeus monodon]